MNKTNSDEKGMLSIESRNIFTILKKWLYTEQDIVFRELISNGIDAIEKLSGSQKTDGRIVVTLDTQAKRLMISDNGIGMNKEEVHKYINQIAFSGATEFINQNNETGKDTIIGHFGVGFYSAFMLVDHVALVTKSYQKDAPGVRWDCLSDMSYHMEEYTKSEIGTDVILYLDENSTYLQKPELIGEIIKKYFVFSKTPIYFEVSGQEPVLMNQPSPIRSQSGTEIEAEQMKTFYKEFFEDVSDPLFWLSFESVDIGVRGILFFRNTKNGTAELDGTIKVYSRGVYIGENIPALIPKFVNLQNGIIECDHLPLSVSRSSIQTEHQEDDIIPLIYETLSQEVTIAFDDMFKNQRSTYEAHWPDIHAFVKYGVLQDKVFASVITRKVIFMDIHKKYYTISEYLDKEGGSHPDTIYYASDELDQAHYIDLFKKCHLNALLFSHVIDQPFMRKYEALHPNLKFVRIDSNIKSLFHGYLNEDDGPNVKVLTEKFYQALGERLGAMTLKITNLDHENISTLIINDEKARRMTDMLEIYGFLGSGDLTAKGQQSKSTLLVNMKNEIVQFILKTSDELAIGIVVNQLFDLSLLSQQSLKPEDMEQFINRSESVLSNSLAAMLPRA